MSLKLELISGLDESRNFMRGVVQLIDDDHEVYPNWQMKHVLAHIAGWDEATIDAIKAYRSGQHIDLAAPKGIDEYNSRSVETRQNLSYEQVMREWEAVREQLKSELNTMNESEITQQIVTPWGETASIRGLVYVMIDHEREHAEEIVHRMKPKHE